MHVPVALQEACLQLAGALQLGLLALSIHVPPQQVQQRLLQCSSAASAIMLAVSSFLQLRLEPVYKSLQRAPDSALPLTQACLAASSAGSMQGLPELTGQKGTE